MHVGGVEEGVVVWGRGGEFVEGDAGVALVYGVVCCGAGGEAAAVGEGGGEAGAGFGGVAVDAQG